MPAIALVFLATVAMADQCAVMTRQQTTEAKAVITEAGQFAKFCGPCEDSESVVEKVASVEVVAFRGSASLFKVLVNGSAIDAAYVYVVSAEGKWMNLANTVGCQATDVSATIPKPAAAATAAPLAPVTPPPQEPPPSPGQK